MSNLYRKPINHIIADIMLETNKRLGLTVHTGYCEVYEVGTEPKNVLYTATTLDRLYSKLLEYRLSLSVDMASPDEVIEDNNTNEFAEFGFESLD